MQMSQPPPRPTPFDGDSSKYLQFRTNFSDQVENRSSLTDSEKMSYLLSYTTGRAKEVIESYQGLPNGCQRALQVLKQRFGQNSMIVQALKSSVVSSPKLRSGDSAGLLALSDKLENCCWSVTELESNELDCTTNLQQIYDRLPDPLQRKWRKSAKLYRERACYRCLSNDHLRSKCPEKKGRTKTECTDSTSHHTLLHITKVKGDNEITESKSTSKSPESLDVHKATVDSAQRSFVLLKVVPVRVLSDNGNAIIITTYGLLDSAAVSSLITSDLA